MQCLTIFYSTHLSLFHSLIKPAGYTYHLLSSWLHLSLSLFLGASITYSLPGCIYHLLSSWLHLSLTLPGCTCNYTSHSTIKPGYTLLVTLVSHTLLTLVAHAYPLSVYTYYSLHGYTYHTLLVTFVT